MVKEIGTAATYELFRIFTSGYNDMKEWNKLTKYEKQELRKRYEEQRDLEGGNEVQN
jgi:hypothetical protein